ncbi:hypothetical protein K1719_023833 [Acacia pycnantha]|nr:hypothetical protein K1719_023833 [Acacia pycnantha]
MGLWKKEIRSEAKKQLWLAGPMVTVSLFMCSLQLISTMFMGHIGVLPPSSASMATSFLNTTGFVALMGMVGALDTFWGQSYGAEQYHMLGIHMQRGMLVILLVAVVQSIILANLRPILVLLHQDHNIAKGPGVYSLYIIPSLFAHGLLQCNIKFLQNQNIIFPMVLTTGISSLIHTWMGFSRESFHNIPQLFRLALPSALMVCLESWMFALMVILSGTFPNPKLQTSVSSICLNTSSLFWTLPFGIEAAASTRISNELGAGSPKAVKVALLMALRVGVTEFSLLMLLRNIWGGAFTNENEVVGSW